MRLLRELCRERGLAAIINIHDVALAQMFAERIVGLRAGEIVYDGAADGLTADVLTRIYGEEDCCSTIRAAETGDEAEAEFEPAHPHGAPPVDRERLAGLT